MKHEMMSLLKMKIFLTTFIALVVLVHGAELTVTRTNNFPVISFSDQEQYIIVIIIITIIIIGIIIIITVIISILLQL